MNFLQKTTSKYALLFAWLIACVATIGSISFSEIKGLQPCTLCWYQRIAMFPLAIILGGATIQKRTEIVPYVLPLSLIGLLVALYHLLIQEIPSLSFTSCGGPSCSAKSLDYSSILAVSFSVASFLLINAFLISLLLYRNRIKK